MAIFQHRFSTKNTMKKSKSFQLKIMITFFGNIKPFQNEKDKTLPKYPKLLIKINN